MKPVNIFISVALAISLSLTLTGCSEESGTNPLDPNEPHPGGSNSAAIGPLGGSVSYGDAVIVFPAGALETVQIVQLGIPETDPDYSSPDSLTRIGYLYKANPEALQLNSSIPVAFLYADPAPEGAAEGTLLLWSLEGDSSTLTPLEDIYIDTAENVITGLTDHLGYYLLTASTDALVHMPPAAPELIAPYDGMPDNALSVTLRWEEAAGADYYHFQVAEDENFLMLFYDGLGITGENIGVSSLAQNTTYYWRVRGHNEHGYGTWSDMWSFSTGGGGYPQSLEGTWQLISGEYHTTGIYYEDWLDIEIWGNVIVSFGAGTFDAEGYRGISRTWNNYLDTTYTDFVEEEGSYVLNGYLMNVAITTLQDPEVMGLNEGEYSVSGDILTMVYYPSWCDGGYVEGQMIFRRI